MLTPSEAELIAGARAGELAAFNALVELYQAQVYNLAYRMLSQREAAEDATQETFLSVFQHIVQFRGDNFRAWLLRIASRACIDQVRRAGRRPAISWDAASADPVQDVEPPDPGEGPEGATLRLELRTTLQRALSTLPPEQRIAVVLCDVQGLSYQEIADAMGTNIGTVRSRLARGRAHLRDRLVEWGELSPELSV
jgi:RNA polymerase sigma-70 factor (ECF subfamily)